ncbi:MAG: methylamine utilization protein [Caulobacteraceae bacterium]|nr:methylamine utilization protein [Caulobacteraceae bacterium]
MRAVLAATAIMVLAPSLALASDLVVTVRDDKGAPVKDAVIMAYPASGLPKGPIKFPWDYKVTQQNIQFNPFVLIVPVGAQVLFPNLDKVRHHVYSFSAGNRFELKLYGREEERVVTFKTVGSAAIGCNIHDQMAAYIQVVDTPYAIKTGADGVATLTGLPEGAAKVRVWQPFMRTAKNEVAIAAVLPASGTMRQAVTVSLRPPPEGMSMPM